MTENKPASGESYAHRQLSWVAVRVDVFVDRPMACGWFAAYKGPQQATPTNDVKMLKACRVYQSWVNSLKRQSVRAVHTNAKGVRLVVDSLVVAGFGFLPHDEWTKNGTRGPLSIKSLTEKEKKNAKTAKQRARTPSKRARKKPNTVRRSPE